MASNRPKLQFEADRAARWQKAREAYERWSVTGNPDSAQAQHWMAGYVSALTDSAPLKCDGNHGGPRCGDPECWNQ